MKQKSNHQFMRDYKLERTPSKPFHHRKRFHGAVIVSAAALGISLLTATPDNAEAIRSSDATLPSTTSTQTNAITYNLPVSRTLTLPEPTNNSAIPLSKETISAQLTPAYKVRRGDTLSSIFSKAGLSAQALEELLSLGKPVATLKTLFPGETIYIERTEDARLLRLTYEIDKTKTLAVSRGNSDNLFAKQIERPIETRTAYAAGTIQDSLYTAAGTAGLPDNIIMQLAGIFGWDIDFALDIRKGDHFSVIYQEHYLEGEKLKDGVILAADFTNRGKRFQAIRYTDPKGNSNYYSPDGRSMRKAFLRSPVDFRRISSRFQRSRLHPVLGKRRAHKGVDYAAAIGTPIKAAGDGKIVSAGWKGGYGKTIVIQHGGTYQTLYAHMNALGRGMKRGKWVKQGQTIGYVGKTGMTTGAHLHYEFRVNGSHRNPLTVKLPDAAPINKTYISDFQAKSSPLLAKLNIIGLQQTAMLNSLKTP